MTTYLITHARCPVVVVRGDEDEAEAIAAGAPILIAGDNFGCGSSREHAAWALQDYGFEVVIAPSESRKLVRESRATIKRCQEDPECVFASDGCAQVLAVGQSVLGRRGGSVSVPIDVSRTIESLLESDRLTDERARAVLNEAVGSSRWGEPRADAIGRGLAVARYKNVGGWCAVVGAGCRRG